MKKKDIKLKIGIHNGKEYQYLDPADFDFVNQEESPSIGNLLLEIPKELYGIQMMLNPETKNC